jgi:polysaccharide pyruvyl transferase WcaK-like protein
MDHMGGGNLGDDTTQTAVICNIRSRWPGAAIYGFSMNPPDTEARHGIPSFPIRRKTWDNPDRNVDHAVGMNGKAGSPGRQSLLKRLLRKIGVAAVKKPAAAFSELIFLVKSFCVIRTLDIFVISGGGQLLDSWGGPWDYPYTIFKWVSLARLSGTRCYFINVGAGPLQYPLSKFFVRHALSQADYVSLRDQKSKALVQEIGFKGEAEVFPDCVYALEVSPSATPQNAPRNEPVVGMSPMAYCDPRRYWIQDQDAYENFIEKLVTFGVRLCEGHRLTLFSTDIWFDSQTLEKVDAALKRATRTSATHLLADEPIMTLQTLLSRMASMDYIITCRFHGVVFAHLMNIPVIALSHHPKVTTLMVDLGLSDYCLDIDAFDPRLLATTFTRMVTNRAGIKARMADYAALYKSQLARQFDQLFASELAQ